MRRIDRRGKTEEGFRKEGDEQWNRKEAGKVKDIQ
jgi:hypothetical protein